MCVCVFVFKRVYWGGPCARVATWPDGTTIQPLLHLTQVPTYLINPMTRLFKNVILPVTILQAFLFGT